MAKLKQPSTLKMGCITYKIVWTDLDDLHGDTDKSKKIIRINKGDSQDVQQETLFHEILHVAMEDMGYLKFNYTEKDDQEEDIIRYISPRLVLALRESPEVLNFIFPRRIK